MNTSEKQQSPHWVGHGLNTGRIFTLAESICRTAPLPMLRVIVDLVMRLACRRLDGPRDAVRGNLRVVCPDAVSEELDRLTRRTFRNYGRCVSDFLRYGNRPKLKLERFFSRIEGMDGCIRILEEGKGLILAAAHVGNWELGGIVFSRFGYPINALAFPEEDPRVEQMRRRKRSNRGIRTFYVGQDLSTLFKIRGVLRRNEVVALLADRCLGKDRIDVDFFGRPTPLMRSPALLSRLSGSPLVPCVILMDGTGRYQALTSTPLVPGTGEDPGAREAARMIQSLARTFEDWIRKHPDQWFNFYPYWG